MDETIRRHPNRHLSVSAAHLQVFRAAAPWMVVMHDEEVDDRITTVASYLFRRDG